MTWHNKLRGGVVDLSRKDFAPMHVHDNPLIYNGLMMNNLKAHMVGQLIGSALTINNHPGKTPLRRLTFSSITSGRKVPQYPRHTIHEH